MCPDYPYFAVAITRTCGSGGGSYIGKQLAKAFDIDLYDRKLLRLASEAATTATGPPTSTPALRKWTCRTMWIC